jgi:hypothetical protein
MQLRQRRHQGLLAALILLKDLRAEMPRPILRHAPYEGPPSRDQPSPIIAPAVAQALVTALVLAGLQTLRPLHLQDRRHRRLNHRHQEIGLLHQSRLHLGGLQHYVLSIVRLCLSGHGLAFR